MESTAGLRFDPVVINRISGGFYFNCRPQAAAVAEGVGAEGALVTVEAQQLCMMMRVDLAPGARTVTTECTGSFIRDNELYQQAWLLLGGEKK